MRPLNGYYGEFDEIDGFDYDNVGAIRHMVDEMLRQDQQIADHKRRRRARKDSWHIDDYGRSIDHRSIDHSENEYADYNEDEFDRYSGLSIGHH